MPAYVIKDAWFPVLRLKLTSILMIGNPHKLLRKNLEGRFRLFGIILGPWENLRKLKQQPGADSLVKRCSICVPFYRVALTSPVVKNLFPFAVICTTSTHVHTYSLFIQAACSHSLGKMVNPVLCLQFKCIVKPFAQITACNVVLLGLIIGF